MIRINHGSRLLLLGAAALMGLSGCANKTPAAYKPPDPFVLEPVAGTELIKLKLQPKAVDRIAAKTEKVTAITQFGPTGSRRIPYDALMYQPDGSTFVYTNPQPNTYLRHAVVVDYIEGETVVVTDGPEVGTAVVTDGAAELMGIEFGVGK